jgi:outer membrane protein TolC
MITKNLNNISQGISLNNNAEPQGRLLLGNQSLLMKGCNLNFSKRSIQSFGVVFFILLNCQTCLAQQKLTLKDALKISVENYGTIRAKIKYAEASKSQVLQAKSDYLPNLNLSAQTEYGTINGISGPQYAFNNLQSISSGPALPTQNWNAAFGGLYLSNINWDFFAFGRSKQKINTAKSIAERDDNDLQQEIFEHQIKVAGAYLNLLAAHQLRQSYLKNYYRADTLRRIVITIAKHDMVAGVDSSQANAEASSARSIWIKSVDAESQAENNLIKLLGIYTNHIEIDNELIVRTPQLVPSEKVDVDEKHPLLQYLNSRIALSQQQTKYFKTLNYPVFSFVGLIQTRGSGFSNSYATTNSLSKGFFDGASPTTGNYLLGVGITWNLTQPLRIKHQVKSQRLISEGLQSELDLTRQQLTAQLQLSTTKITDAIMDYHEIPFQLKGATDVYRQKTVLYRNGLTSLVDVTQALYALIRAETDRDIATTNVWQALLLSAASQGNFSVFSANL